jgi:hypothetical protein
MGTTKTAYGGVVFYAVEQPGLVCHPAVFAESLRADIRAVTSQFYGQLD